MELNTHFIIVPRSHFSTISISTITNMNVLKSVIAKADIAIAATGETGAENEGGRNHTKNFNFCIHS
jgi:hypothetical protein